MNLDPFRLAAVAPRRLAMNRPGEPPKSSRLSDVGMFHFAVCHPLSWRDEADEILRWRGALAGWNERVSSQGKDRPECV
jgi:hypothetical protein